MFSIYRLIPILGLMACTSVVTKVGNDLKELPIPLPVPELAKNLPDCQKLDWFGLGHEEGIRGNPLSILDEKVKACKNSTPEHRDLFWHGWNAGIAEYCAPSNGFALGQSGTPYLRVCPEGIMEKFDRSYQMGLKVFLIEKENQNIVLKLKENSNKTELQDLLKQKQIANSKSIQEIKRNWETRN